MDHRRPAHTAVPIAIIGMACRLPGANGLDEFWELLANRRSGIREFPPERLDRELYYDPRPGTPGKTYVTVGGIVDDRDRESSIVFPPEWLRDSDPAHVTIATMAAEACAHAGIDPWDVPIRNTGVFVAHDQGDDTRGCWMCGLMATAAAELPASLPEMSSLSDEGRRAVATEFERAIRMGAAGNHSGVHYAAELTARLLRAEGPSLVLNSACASSLHAAMVAARALQRGEIEMAIVAGGSTLRHDTPLEFSKVKANSPTGSRPFDDGADGVVCSEGYAAIVIKTLPRALEDGDRVLALLRGFGVASDGRGKGLWAPDRNGQMAVVRRAYGNGIELSQIDYIEAHATSTPLGDVTELRTLTEVLRGQAPANKRIPVSSVKANIGHTLETAGLAGLIKTVLCLQHGRIPPAINITRLNTRVAWEEVPFYIPTEGAEWPAKDNGEPRRAGVDAFGLGGLNMHVALEEYMPHHWTNDVIDAIRSSAQFPKDDGKIAIIGFGLVENENDDFQYDWRRHRIPPKQMENADPLQFMLLDAVDQAMARARLDKDGVDRSRIAILVGSEFGGDFEAPLQLLWRLPEFARSLDQILSARGVDASIRERLIQQFTEIATSRWPMLFDETGSFQHSSLASRIARTWDLMGGAASIDAGPRSGFEALRVGMDLLLSGDCDTLICAAGSRRSFIAPGERPSGAAAIVLQLQSAAQRKGSDVFGVLCRRIEFNDEVRLTSIELQNINGESMSLPPDDAHDVAYGLASLIARIIDLSSSR